MDTLCDKIRLIKENMNMEYSDVPEGFFFKDKTRFNSTIFSLISLMKKAYSENDFNTYVSNMVMIFYYLLDRLVEQGIYPDSILELMIYDDLQKIWKDGTLHYDCGKIVNPPDYVSISSDIDKEILSMKEGHYKKGNMTITDYYNKILHYYDLIHTKCNDTPSFLSSDQFSKYYNKISNGLESYLLCDYVEEEAEELIGLLYRTLKFFTKMGINPQKYINELIDKMSKKKSKKM